MNADGDARALISSLASAIHWLLILRQVSGRHASCLQKEGVVLDQHLPILLIIRITWGTLNDSLLDLPIGFSESVGLGGGQKSVFKKLSRWWQ